MKQTIQNLATAFIGESQARNRYTIYAKTATKEGYDQIAEIFLQTAEQEREHAKWLFYMIQNLKKGNTDSSEPIMVIGEVPTTLGTTIENLQAAIMGENHEHNSMYPEYARIAEEEGLMEVANRIRAISKAEEHHEERYKKLLAVLQSDTIFKKTEKQVWTCRKCGYTHENETPPDACPSCSHPTGYFQLKCEIY